MSRATVAIVACRNYDPETVYAAVTRGVELLGGVDCFARPGERLLLKPNMLCAEPPEKAITTHPAVLSACARALQRSGATLTFGDAPGRASPEDAARATGLLEAATREGVAQADFQHGQAWRSADGSGGWPVAQAVHECDGLVNLAKAKTHQLTRLTGAVKNLYGCVPGRRKALYHVQRPDVLAFSDLLARLALAMPARLHVLDAVVAMEGNGPRSGDPRPLGVLLLSADPVALDATFCRLVGLDPTMLPTNVIGEGIGLGVYRQEEIDLVGDDLEALRCLTFGVIRQPVSRNTSWAHFSTIRQLVLARPIIDADLCRRCGECVDACPVPDKALHIERRGGPPEYDYAACIRCYCCLEMCPHRAIYKRTPLLGRVLGLD